MDVQTYLLLLIAIVFAVVAQLLWKLGMSRRPNFRLKDLAALTGEFPVLGGFICLGISILLYLQALANLNLSVAYPTVSLGYVLVMLQGTDQPLPVDFCFHHLRRRRLGRTWIV
jgi:multidrug transporter EmrE-like cation transporter